jgi:hypothetical protein
MRLERFLGGDPDFRALCARNLSSPARESAPNWIRNTRRQLYSHLFFVDTVRDAFGPNSPLARDKPTEVIRKFDLLRDARHRLELDTAAGWRRTAEARKQLGLATLSDDGTSASTEM